MDSLIKGYNKTFRVTFVFQTPMLFLPFLDIFFCFFGNGMIESMLEPHLRTAANASQSEIGITFLILGGSYMVATPVMGFVSKIVILLSYNWQYT